MSRPPSREGVNSRDLKSRPSSREGLYSRPHSRDSGRHSSVSRSSSSRALLSRNNAKIRESIRVLHEQAAQIGSSFNIQACCGALKSLSSAIEQSKDYLDWIRDSRSLDDVLAFLYPSCEPNVIVLCMGVFRQSMVLDRRKQDCIQPTFTEMTCETSYQCLFGITLRGLQVLLSFLGSGAPSPVEESAVNLFEVTLTSNLQTQEVALSLGYLAILLDFLRSKTCTVPMKCTVLRCLSHFKSADAIQCMLQNDACELVVECFRSANAYMKVEAAKVLTSTAQFHAAQVRMEALKITPFLVVAIAEEDRSVCCAALETLICYIDTFLNAFEGTNAPDFNNTATNDYDVSEREQCKIALYRLQIISCSFARIMQIAASGEAKTSLLAGELLCRLLALASVESKMKKICEQGQTMQVPTEDKQIHVSEHSFFGELIATILISKDRMALLLTHFLSSSSFLSQQTGIKILDSFVQVSPFISNIKEREDFQDIAGGYSVLWALYNLIAREDVSTVIQETAANFWIRICSRSSIARSLMSDPSVATAIAKVSSETVPPSSEKDSSKKTDQVLALLPLTTKLNDVLSFCTDIVRNAELSYKIRLESAIWMQGLIRANSAARAGLSEGSFTNIALESVERDLKIFPTRLMCAVLDVCADLCSSCSYAPVSSVRSDKDVQGRLMSSVFLRMLKLNTRFLIIHQIRPEPKLVKLLGSCCRLLLAIISNNSCAIVFAVKAGILKTAHDLIQSDLMTFQIFGLQFVEAICAVSPSMALLFQRFPSGSPEIGSSDSGSIELEDGQMPWLLSAILKVLDQTRPFKFPATATSEATVLDQDPSISSYGQFQQKLGTLDSETLVSSSLRALSAIFKWSGLSEASLGAQPMGNKPNLELCDREKIMASIALHVEQGDPELQCLAIWTLLLYYVGDCKQNISSPTKQILCHKCEEVGSRSVPLLVNSIRGLSLLSLAFSTPCVSPETAASERSAEDSKATLSLTAVIDLLKLVDDESEKFVNMTVKILCGLEWRWRQDFYNQGGFLTIIDMLDTTRRFNLCRVGARSVFRLISADCSITTLNAEMDAALEKVFDCLGPLVKSSVQIVVQLLSSAKNPVEISAFLDALGALCSISQNAMIQTEDVLGCLTSFLTSESSIVISSSANALAVLIAFWRGNVIREKVKATGAIPCMISLLSCPDDSVQTGILSTLKALSREAKIRKLVTQNRAIEHVVRLMKCTSCDFVRSKAAEYIGDLIQTSPNIKMLLEFDGVDFLMQCLEANTPAVVVSAAASVQKLMTKKDSHGSTCWSLLQTSFRTNQAALRLKNAFNHHKEPIAVQACIQTLGALCKEKSFREDIMSANTVTSILELACDSTTPIGIQGSALVCLGILLTQGFMLPSNIQTLICEKLFFFHCPDDHQKLKIFCQCLDAIATQAEIRRYVLNQGFFPIIFKALQTADNYCRTYAAGALEAWSAADTSMIVSWSKSRGLKSLFELLLGGFHDGAEQAARTFAVLCKSEQAVAAIQKDISKLRAEGLQVFCKLMNEAPTSSLKLSCSAILREIARHQKWTPEISKFSLESFVEMLHSDDPEVVFSGCSSLAVIASEASKDDKLSKSGVCPILCSLLQEFSEDIRCEACLVISKIGGKDSCKKILLQFEALSLLVHLLQSDSPRLILSAAEAIEALLDSYACQEEFVKRNGLMIVGNLLDMDNISIRCSAARLTTALAKDVQSKEAVLHVESLIAKIARGISSDVDHVVEVYCELVSILSGNSASINQWNRSRLSSQGVIGSLASALARPSMSVKSSSMNALSKFNLADVRKHVTDDVLMTSLIELLSSEIPRFYIVGTKAVTNFISSDQVLRLRAVQNGIIGKLEAGIRWAPKKGEHGKPTVVSRIRSSSADALASLLECYSCRHGYQGLEHSILDIQGTLVPLPSISQVLPCNNRNTCLMCAQSIAGSSVLDGILSMLRSADVKMQSSAALVLAPCAVGAPNVGGCCKYAKQIAQQCLSADALDSLSRMLRTQALNGKGEYLQTAACTAISALCIHETARKECCARGFIKQLAILLVGSTCARLKSAAACALARMSFSDSSFYWNSQTLRTWWATPDDLKFATNASGEQVILSEDEVAYDVKRAGYWVRGIFKPLVKIPYREILTSTFEVKSGMNQGIIKLKADNEIVTPSSDGLIEAIADIFKSDLYDDIARGMAAEAMSLLAEYEQNRQYFVSHGCVPQIVTLLDSRSLQSCQQAANVLSILLANSTAREIAAGSVQRICDILNNKHSSAELLQSAMLALAKLCSSGSNQVSALRVGVLMPLVEFLTHTNQCIWYCAVEALCALSANEQNKRAMGIAGAVSALVYRAEVHVPVAVQVRILATLSNLIADPTNCDQAVEAGLIVRLTNLGRLQDQLLFEYVIILMKSLCHFDKWKQRLVDCGLNSIIIAVCLNLERTQAHSDALTVNIVHILCSMSKYECFKQKLVDDGALNALRVILKARVPEAQAMACETLSLLGTKDAWKVAAREAGTIPLLAGLVRSKVLSVRLEAASAIRVLASNLDNKCLLVKAGCLHGLRDMLEIDNIESKTRASSAIQILSRQQENGAAMAAAGAIRPLVNLISCDDSQIQSNVSLALHNLARNQARDTRQEIVGWGAVVKLASALESSSCSPALGLQLARCCDDLARNVQLDCSANKSSLLVEARVGQVPADDVARRTRGEMLACGVGRRLAQLALTSPDPSLAAASASCLSKLEGHTDLG